MEKLFRKESIDRIASPEQLHDYMRVTSPRVWMVLAAVAVLLAGFLVYASTATMESTLKAQAVVYSPSELEMADGYQFVSILLPLSDKELVLPGMEVRLAGLRGTVDYLYQTEQELALSVRMESAGAPLPEGMYEAEIVTESTTPISFLLN